MDLINARSFLSLPLIEETTGVAYPFYQSLAQLCRHATSSDSTKLRETVKYLDRKGPNSKLLSRNFGKAGQQIENEGLRRRYLRESWCRDCVRNRGVAWAESLMNLTAITTAILICQDRTHVRIKRTPADANVEKGNSSRRKCGERSSRVEHAMP